MTARSQKQKIEKALMFVRPIPSQLAKKKQSGMTAKDADTAVEALNRAVVSLESALRIYGDAERRYAIMTDTKESGGLSST